MKLRTLKPAIRMLERQSVRQSMRPRGSTARGYDRQWRNYRERWLQQHPLCGDREHGPSAEHSICQQQKRTTAATDVDHIERVNGQRDPLFWEPSNHQSLCHSCHSIKTQHEQAGGRVETLGGFRT